MLLNSSNWIFCMHFNFISMFCLTGRRNDWCFFCEFENHLDRANHSRFPFSPMNIISRLPNIGGNLGYGRQEDAHELMRSAIVSCWCNLAVEFLSICQLMLLEFI